MDDVGFKLAHISDLHFSSGSDKSNQSSHTHSIDHLIGLEKSLGSMGELDMVVVSGDVSNKGDRQSLIMASGWLFSQIPIGGNQYTGLKLPTEKVGVVPGNHDAWNAGTDGILLDRRQRSIENYNFAFPEHIVPESGCSFKWLEQDGRGIYIAFVDSCFLGDTADDTDSTFGTLRYDALAKGKLTVKQTEKLLEWHDMGSKGILIPAGSEKEINKEMFAKSLKVLVMHHYLFEPPEKKSDYFMRVHHRDVVFQNIAMSDFDVLLCGHKHISAFDVHDYGNHFDDRAVNRHMFNYFRRLIGLHSLPIQFVDEQGRRFSKALTNLAQLIASLIGRNSSEKQDADTISEGVYGMLKAGLDDPDQLSRNLKNFLSSNGVSGASALEPGEIKRIEKKIATGLSMNERKRLKSVADQVTEFSKRLKSRSFVQIMSGSSAKMPSTSEQRRSFQTYQVQYMNEAWRITSQRYDWIGSEFKPNSEPRVHFFKHKF